MKKWIILLVSVCLFYLVGSLYCGLTVRKYRITSKKVHNNEDFLQIAMLSDLHSYEYGKNQQKLLDKIKAEKPDVIALCGDMVDDKKPQDGAFRLLRQLAEIAPTYYVSGNHEYWSNETQKIFDEIQNCGIHVLHNETVSFLKGKTEYTITGIDDPAISGDGTGRSYGEQNYMNESLQSFRTMSTDPYNILLSHRPEYFEEYMDTPFDLILCGHAHGGQWRIPGLLNGVYAPNQGFFPKYAGGQYTSGEQTEIVGRGLVRDWKVRIWNPPELVVVSISAKGSSSQT